MKTIFFNQRALILCREGERAEKDPEAVIVIDSGDDTILANAVNTIDTGSGIRRLYVLCDNPELTYERIRKLFTEVDAAGGLICNDLGEFLLIFRNGMWDLPKGKREKGESTAENAVREVMEECGIPAPELGELRNPCPGTWRTDMRYRPHISPGRTVRTQAHLLVLNERQQQCAHQASDRRGYHTDRMGAGRGDQTIRRTDLSVHK